MPMSDKEMAALEQAKTAKLLAEYKPPPNRRAPQRGLVPLIHQPRLAAWIGMEVTEAIVDRWLVVGYYGETIAELNRMRIFHQRSRNQWQGQQIETEYNQQVLELVSKVRKPLCIHVHQGVGQDGWSH